jgi:hypothetical protein
MPTDPTAAPAPRTCFYIEYGQFDERGYIPSLVTENEPGHAPLKGRGACADAWHWGATYEQAKAHCEAVNRKHGISPRDALDIVFSSMRASGAFGMPAAGPAAGRFQAILDQLPVTARPGVYLEPQSDGTLAVLEESGAPEDAGSAAILGVATQDGAGRWYLGCQTCKAEISEADSGMCVPCRQDLELRDRDRQAADEGWIWS